MKRFAFLATALTVCVASATTQAATIFSMSARAATSAESAGGGAPAEGRVVQFFLTTDAPDILAIQNVAVQTSADGGTTWVPAANIYNNAVGSDAAKPQDALVAAIPALGADSWIRLSEGTATMLGNTAFPGDGGPDTAWGDTVAFDPPDNFQFAQLTFPKGTVWRFSGLVATESSPGVVATEAFEFVPEPTSAGLAGLGMLALAGFRRRFSA